jgi:phosphatidylinositol glycan class M
MNTIGRLLLVPQLILLFVSSLLLGPYNITVTIFLQTYIFVIQNKVITAQYFTWYLCLLPLCSSIFTITKDVLRSVGLLLLSIVIWLGTAYCLEMQGMAVHYYVWIASLLFYIANINLVRALITSIPTTTTRYQQTQQQQHLTTTGVSVSQLRNEKGTKQSVLARNNKAKIN